GACLGGGCELALACDARVASASSKTRIGLPEVMLGIIPAWGGATRMPRLVGLPAALDLILGGKRLAAKKAMRVGLVDEVVPRLALRDAAMRFAKKKPGARKSHALTNNRLAAALIARKAASAAEARSRGLYPAIPAAIDVVTKAVSRSVPASLAAEREAEMRLAKTDECESLISVFLLQERAKQLPAPKMYPGLAAPASDRDSGGVEHTAVIGAGIMGAGIAQWLSSRGYTVILRDIDEDRVRAGLASIARVYASGVKRRAIDKTAARDGLDRIHPSAREVPLASTDLVVEAVVENLEIKQQIFSRLEELTGDRTVLATNTSALSIDAIADGLRYPERVIGLHFFNPVHRMQLVEIVMGRRTDPAVGARMLALVRKIGKLPVVTKDTPGFLVNRILMPYLVEAGHLFSGGAGAKDLDETMLDFGMPMGPLRLMDEVGIDVGRHVADFLGSVFKERMPVPTLLAGMVDAGMLGRKAGAGFYVYGGSKKEAPKINEKVLALQTAGPAASMSRDQMQSRMVLLMVNESARCLQEEVVGAPEDVDLAMVMGTGFAPFRGGPLRHADSVGAARIVERLEELAAGGDPRFVPCELIKNMASRGDCFYKR
ncbi:MAG: 3-hydroxyacyl-CoA dehydrogenase NAD-binding domain-containing protein, partial [Acidobacteriota bacterium]|nr:3-hydroxyacyl-CoA dehydrogenase NAD-binding domain-containing protein [Acidobacteriota bacterium]